MILLSSFIAGTIATLVMLGTLYVPMLWNCDYCDVLKALGLFMRPKNRLFSRFIGAVPYLLYGLGFAIIYGWFAYSLMNNSERLHLPQILLVSGLGLQVNLLYPLLGLVIGLGQGIIAALITTVLIIEHHPLEHFHHRLTLVFSQVAGHLVFGMVVMLSQSLIFSFGICL